MISSDLKQLAAPFERTTRFIWLAFINASLVYCVLSWFLTQGGDKQLGDGQLPGEAIYVAILVAVASGVVFPWIIAPRLAGPARMMQSPDARPVSFEGDSARAFERLSERDQQRALMLGGIQSARIVQWAGAESVAIYGLLALLMGVTNMYGAWAFAFAAAALLYMLRPDFEGDLEKL